MRKVCALLLLCALLSGCGRPGAGAHGSAGEVCALIARPQALFGANATSDAAGDVGDGSCRWASVDGRRGGELIVFSGRHLEGATPQAFVAETAQRWGAAQPDYPIESIAGLGDEARIASRQPGFQTQIVFRKADRAIALQAWSGDPALSAEQIARRMAESANGALK